jgi:AcrR family transcriptional regulator
MAYRRTENVLRRLAARHDAIVDAARTAADTGGMAAIQIAPIAERAGVAAGTVYRYFPGKIELVGALIESVSGREIEELRRVADGAPGPLSALAAAIATFAARALRSRRLTWAVIAEPVDADTDAVRQS